MDFFKPTEAWFSWAVGEFGNEVVVDAGCGFGSVVRRLASLGVNALGVELDGFKVGMGREEAGDYATPIFIGDAIGHSVITTKPVTVLFLRPCHSEWISKVITSTHPGSRFFYVSNPENVEIDLIYTAVVPLEYRRAILTHTFEAGEEDEQVFEVRKVPDEGEARDLKVWSLRLRDGNVEWWKKSGDRWYNEAGGWNPVYPGDVVLETARTTDPFWLDPTRTTTWQEFDRQSRDPSILSGWVREDGRFFRCRYEEHDSLLYRYLLVDVSTAEARGWARIDPPDGAEWRSGASIRVLKKIDWRKTDLDNLDGTLTREQVRAILDAGIEISDWQLEEAEKGWENLTLPEWPNDPRTIIEPWRKS